MKKKESDSPKVLVDCFDVSDEYLIEKVKEYLDKGIRVQVMSLEKDNPDFKAEHTFLGNMAEQERPGFTLNSYKPIEGDCLIQID